MLSLTVYFENPFWVGVFEYIENGRLTASKVTFGAEPKDYDVYDFVQKHFFELSFSPAVAFEIDEKPKNPKRLQRELKKQMQPSGVGTKSQQALQLQREQGKLERRTKSRERRQEEMQYRFELRQRRKKEKHKGH